MNFQMTLYEARYSLPKVCKRAKVNTACLNTQQNSAYEPADTARSILDAA